ncbi:MAG: energy transducer TonB [Thermoanaerobaculia bacterium]|nr:energy transducer TonB [Thermoanaerobaculia bacterium]
MKPTKDDIRRRLGLREVPKPPEDLARRIKAEIPASFRYRDSASAGRKSDVASAASWGMSWQVAASFLALTIVGVGIYMVTFESQKSETATASIAEADGRESLEFSPPTAPTASSTTLAPESPAVRSRQSEKSSNYSYDIAPAPPPPPPPPSSARAQTVEKGVEGGVEGGVLGGVVGGVIGTTDDRAEKLAEAQALEDRDKGYAEEKENLAATGAPAPAAIAEPGRRDAKDEQARGMAVAQSAAPKPATMAKEGVSLQTPGEDTPLRICCNIKAPEVIERVEIVYPEKAKKVGIQGIVIVEAVIDRNGSVKSARVLKPLPMGLDEAAVAAIKQWKFKPATLDGKPVEVFWNITVNAKLAR